MKCSSRHRAARLAAASTLAGMVACAQASVATEQPPTATTECLGYYTIELPGEFEYALMGNFSQGLGAWGSELRLTLRGLEQQELFISQPATVAKLMADMEAMNAERQREIDDVSERLTETKPTQSALRSTLQEKISELHQFEVVARHDAVTRVEKDKLSLHALVNGHIFYTSLPLQGTPEQTLDAFLGHYKPRALGEVPKGPGVCVPFGVFSDEKLPAVVGLNLRLKAQPDIVVFLLARDAASNAPEDPEKYIDRKTMPMTMFYGSRGAIPLHRLRPLEAISIDGHKGTGTFASIKRQTQGYVPEIHNAAADALDMGYLAYIPGTPGRKPGESFNVEFKVERFGRFANRPMSEKEFRELVMRIAASIKLRPGAWQAQQQ